MGCGSSLSSLPSIQKNKIVDSTKTNVKSGQLPSINSQRKLTKDKDQREENLEPFTLVCLDKHFQANDKQLRSIIDYVCCFEQLKQCEEFIQDINRSRRIFFIVSNDHFTNMISHIHDLSHIIAIYVFQDNKSKTIDKHWTKRYAKLKGVYSDREILLEQLASDVTISININDLIPISVYSRIDALQTTTNSTDHLYFLFYQLFIQHYCLNSSTPTSSKNDFIHLIEKYYSSNRHELKLINEFNHEYNSSKNVLPWFIKEGFLRRILTQSLIRLDIKTLFSLRFFIKDMHKIMIDQPSALNQKHTSYQNGSARFNSGRSTNEQVFYRGQALAKETFMKIKANIGEILSMNNFMLASRSRQDSLGFLRQHISITNSVYRILFEIKIPWEYSLQKQRPFIDLTSFHDSNNKSHDDDEKEFNSILFFIGSIFRINTVEFDINNDCWIIQLTLYDERTNQDFSQVFTFLNDVKHTPTETTATLANLLRQISSQSAEQFYQYLLKENSTSLSKLECYRGLGLCSYSQNNYPDALIYFHKALQLKPNEKLIKSSLHNSMGLVYARQDQIDEALNHFNKALENSSVPLHTACVHHNLALVYSKQEQYEDELDHYEEAFKIRTRQLPAHHLQLASLHNNIGIAYSDMYEYDQSLTNLRKALEIRLKLLSDVHIDVARSYANIGTVYSKTQEYRMAIDYFNKAHLLFEKQQPIPQQDLEQLDKNMKIVNDKLRRKTY